jgi:hypothetical protein
LARLDYLSLKTAAKWVKLPRGINFTIRRLKGGQSEYQSFGQNGINLQLSQLTLASVSFAENKPNLFSIIDFHSE